MKKPTTPSKPPTRLRKAARQVAAVASAVAEEGRGVLEAVRAVLTDSIDPRIRKLGREATDEEIARLVLLSEPAVMAEKLSGGTWIPASHLRLISKAIHDCIMTPGGGRLMISIPPRHGKTELASIWTSAWFLSRWPDRQVIFTTHGADFAEDKVGRPTRDLMNRHVGLLGVPIRDDSKAAGRWTTQHGGGLIAIGAGGQLTGRGAHLLIADDVVKGIEMATSETQLEHMWEWWQADVMTRLEPKASVIVIATRWAEGDLIGRLLQSPNAAKWKYIRFPAIAEEDDVLGRKVGDALWPQRYSLEDLLETKAGTAPQMWAGLYQQNPSDLEGDLIKRDWWRYYNPAELPPLQAGGPKWERLIQSWDTSFTDATTSDFVVGQVWGLWKGNLYLVAQTRARMNFPTTCDAIRALSARWPQATSKLIEQSANGYAIISTLQHEVQGIIPVSTRSQSKVARVIGRLDDRAQAVSAIIRNGQVWLPDPTAPSFEWVRKFVDECTAFPNAQHDDQCFAAGTMVATSQGDRAIETLQVGDSVLVPGGVGKVIAAGLTGKKLVADFAGLQVTENHRIFSGGQFTRVDALTQAFSPDRLSLCGQIRWAVLRAWSSTVSSTGSWERGAITSVSQDPTLVGGALKVFTSLYGRLLREREYRRANLFITRTAIHSITTLATWSAYRIQSMDASTQTRGGLQGSWHTWSGSARKLLYGIGRRLVECGISNMGQLLGGIVRSSESIASIAGRLSGLIGPSWPRLALPNVDTTFDVPLDTTMSLAPVSSAGVSSRLSFHQTQAELGRPAQGSAQPVFVYNLTVDVGCYYAGKILVSNCDAMSQALAFMQPSAWVGAKREPQPTTIAEMRAREHEAYLKKLMRPKEEEGRRERYEYLNLNR